MIDLTFEQLYIWYKIGNFANSAAGLFFLVLAFFMFIFLADKINETDRNEKLMKTATLSIIASLFIALAFEAIAKTAPTQKEVLFYLGYKEYQKSGVIDNVKGILDAVEKRIKDEN